MLRCRETPLPSRKFDDVARAWQRCLVSPLCLHLGKSDLKSCLFQDVDLVPTDVAAGFVLLEEEQSMEPRKYILEKMSSPIKRVPSYLASRRNESSEAPPDLVDIGSENAPERAGSLTVHRPMTDEESSGANALPTQHTTGDV